MIPMCWRSSPTSRTWCGSIVRLMSIRWNLPPHGPPQLQEQNHESVAWNWRSISHRVSQLASAHAVYGNNRFVGGASEWLDYVRLCDQDPNVRSLHRRREWIRRCPGCSWKSIAARLEHGFSPRDVARQYFVLD